MLIINGDDNDNNNDTMLINNCDNNDNEMKMISIDMKIIKKMFKNLKSCEAMTKYPLTVARSGTSAWTTNDADLPD